MNTDHKTQWLEALSESLSKNTFVKISLGHYKGDEAGLKNIYIKRIIIKQEQKLSFTYRYQIKDIVKNYSPEEAISHLLSSVKPDGFRTALLFTTAADLFLEYLNGDKISLKKKPASYTDTPSLEHDKQKNRLIESKGKHYLTELRITDASGKVFHATQDKYKQINHYIEILSSLLRELPVHETLRVIDMGAGKGYLTFALYDYLVNVLKLKAEVTGVEFRPDLVELCNQIAKKSEFDGLHFVQGSIQDYDSTGAHVLIALHACDTATDDAIAKGITAGADLIVVAPCCHKQIRREIEQHKHKNELEYLTQYGLFLERQAEMVTDGIRALILEYFGYAVKVIDFVSDTHTPKNVMLIAVKHHNVTKSERILQKIKEAKAFFGIQRHHLEGLLGLR
jgi:tRNA A58 N-methylase Trm61